MKFSRIIVVAALATLVISTAANAQGGLIQFGVKGGVTTQGVKFSGSDKVDPNVDFSTNSRAGFHLGIVSRINLPMLHFQPELLYSQTSYRLGVSPSNVPITEKSIVRLKSVEIPTLVGLKVMWLHIQAGPMFKIMSETKMKDRGYIEDVGISAPSVSYLLGIGVDLGRINLDVRYNGNFKKYTQSILYGTNIVGEDFRSKHKSWMFSVGYLF